MLHAALTIVPLCAYEPTRPSERRALATLHAVAADAATQPWGANTSKMWLHGDPCGDAPYYCGENCNGWMGVHCWGPGGHVRRLDLRRVPLHGTIPSQIGLLSELATLDLSRAARTIRGVPESGGLSGTLPTQLGRIRFVRTDADASSLLLAGQRLSGCLLYTSPSPRDS